MFHHPLQLFRDSTDKMQSDISVIKNASTVIDRLMTNKINIVLHGHKHMALINPITNDSFLHNMNNIIYAIAAGSIGKENITNRMFQVVEIFNKLEEPKKIRVIPLEYSQEKCTRKETIEIPPKQENIGYMQGIIKEILQEHNMYNEYIDKVQEVDLCSQKHGINRIIEFIERTILNFPEVRKRVLEIRELGLFSVLVVHLRVNSYAEQNNKKK